MVGEENTIIIYWRSHISWEIHAYLDFVKIKYCIALSDHCLATI